MPSWGIQSIQLAWFNVSPSQRSPADLFKDIVGIAAATTQSRGPLSNASGIENQHVWRLNQRPDRIDLFLNPPPQRGPIGQLPLLSDVKASIAALASKFPAGTAAIGDVVRLALVTTISTPVASAAEANKVILNQLGFSLPFDDGSDLIIQVNRRKALASSKIQLNRVMKWHSENFQHILMSAGAPIIQAADLASMTADINTMPVGRAFPPAEQISIFGEIVTETERVCVANALTALD